MEDISTNENIRTPQTIICNTPDSKIIGINGIVNKLRRGSVSYVSRKPIVFDVILPDNGVRISKKNAACGVFYDCIIRDIGRSVNDNQSASIALIDVLAVCNN